MYKYTTVLNRGKNMFKVFIDGSAGTTGLRINERLSERDDIEIIKISDADRKDLKCRKEAIISSDAAFLCLPDEASKEMISELVYTETKILDTSTAHRTSENWAYGFPELSTFHRKKIIYSSRTAVPGCHASGFVALVYPLVRLGIMPENYPVCAFSLTGYSGGGKKMIAEYESDKRDNELNSPRQYGLTQNHKHLPEMMKICGLSAPPVFIPTVADFYSGMTVSVPLYTSLLNKKYGVVDFYKFFSEFYAGKKTIKVLPTQTEGFVGTNNLSGSDGMEIIISGNDERIYLASRFDNLGKGASGAAVQCLNLMLGVEETKGLVLNY